MPLSGKPAVVSSRALQDSNGTLSLLITFCLIFFVCLKLTLSTSFQI
jgi:hypothetical protein